jgi:SAM-dependent methyltransferase
MSAEGSSAGYLSDTTYPDRFHRELSPAWLQYVAVHGGAAPRALDAPFAYLDLGCGFAHSLVVNAGAFPHADFHACDFNAAHIEAATRHAERWGVRNVTFYQALFDDLLRPDVPLFDCVVLHGVYSWVGPDVRRTIREILARKVKPGGWIYVSYNCLPGWAAESPLRKLLLELARDAPGGAEERAKHGLEGLARLATPSLKYFRDEPGAVAAVESFAKDPTNYLAHEFLNETWQLYYSVDVADDMALAGASFVASATLADNHPMLVIDKAAGEAIAALPTARLRQVAMDFAVNQRFRRDLFVKDDTARATGAALLRRLDDLVVGCAGDVDAIGPQAVIPRGKISFQPDFIRELRPLLRRGSMRVGDLVAALGGAGRNPIEIRQNLFFLVAAGALAPFAHVGPADATTPGRAASDVIASALRAIVAAGEPAVIPSPLMGNGTLVTVDEATQATRWLAAEPIDPPARLVRLGLLHLGDL